MEHGGPHNLKFSILLAFICIFALGGGRELRTNTLDLDNYGHAYNRTLAEILVEYASAVYMDDLSALLSWTCSRCNGLTEGFQVVELIVDVQHCLQAFVGVAEDLNAIVIAFRGTQERSLQNWVEDLFCKTLDLNYPNMPGAMVHYGFYSAYHNTTLGPHVVEAVQKAQKQRDGLRIIVTGHSMGGAMAAFCALDLTVWLYNLGVGSLRYEVEKVCDGSGEDASCSRSVSGNSIADHLQYYGVSLQAESWGSCGIPWNAQMNKNDEKVEVETKFLVDSMALGNVPEGKMDNGHHSAL